MTISMQLQAKLQGRDQDKIKDEDANVYLNHMLGAK